MRFNNAQTAFEYLYRIVNNRGTRFGNTKALFNIGFYIDNPLDNDIQTEWRNFSKHYAEYEWEWYLSGDRSAVEISKKAKIWEKCMDHKGEVNSNYGWHWKQSGQLDYVINELKNNPKSRRASISIYNAKDRYNFNNDTPCTYAINFTILNNKLNMSVMMRSNDLWFGFCNDQYCFSKLQELVSNKLGLNIGSYYHFVNNLHLYNNFLNRQPSESKENYSFTVDEFIECAIRNIAKVKRVDKDSIFKKSRKRHIVVSRHYLFHLLYKKYKHYYLFSPSLANYCDLDRLTVRHGHYKMLDLMSYDNDIREDLDIIYDNIMQEL